jgi:LytS/YehU family sensor histidine kinase
MFNALNNIYALSVQKNEQTPEAVMKLSQMMRYVLYESNVETVPVKREWEYIENYIDVQLLKFENQVNVGRQAEITEEAKIAPMLLLPFVENAFKHSNIEVDESAAIEIVLNVKDGRLQFTVENTLPRTEVSKDAIGGIGLENVKRRLAYIYPDQHELDISKGPDKFKVTLKIKLP